MTFILFNKKLYLNFDFFDLFKKVILFGSYYEDKVKEMYKLIDDLLKEKHYINDLKLRNKIHQIFMIIILKYIKEYRPPSIENNSGINREIIRFDKELKKIILSSSIYSFKYGDKDINTFTYHGFSSIFYLFLIDKKAYYIYNYAKYLQLVLTKKNISKFLVYIIPYLNLINCDNLMLKFKKFNLIPVRNTGVDQI